jgi:hypothetical protein
MPLAVAQRRIGMSRCITMSIGARYVLKVRVRRTWSTVQQGRGGEDDLGLHNEPARDRIDARCDIVVNCHAVADRQTRGVAIEWRPTVRELGIACR